MAALNGYLALGTLSAAGVFTEISSATGYARQSVSFVSASAGSVRNAAAINFPNNSGSARWPAFGAYAVYDSLTGGNLLFAWGIDPGFGANPSRSPLPGRNYRIPSGFIKLEFPVAIAEGGSEVVLSKPFLWTPGGLQRFEEAPITLPGSVPRALGDQLASYQHPGLYNFKPSNLKKWRKALARMLSGDANAKLACVGDSTTAGHGATGVGEDNALSGGKALAYPRIMAGLLDRGGLPAQESSFFGSGNITTGNYNSYDPRVALTAGWSSSGSFPGGTGFGNSTTTSALSFTPTQQVDTFDIYYLQDSGKGTFTANVDGGATLATVATAGTSGIVKATVTTTLGTHTLNIARTTGGEVLILGVDAYNSASRVISVWGMGLPSSTSGQWAASLKYNVGWSFKYYAPDLTIINLGINDWNTGVAVSSYKANMQTNVEAALLSGDAILTVPVPSAVGVSTIQDQYAAALYEVANAYDVPLIDLRQRFGSWEDANALGFYRDTLHPTALGYADIAQLVAKALMI